MLEEFAARFSDISFNMLADLKRIARELSFLEDWPEGIVYILQTIESESQDKSDFENNLDDVRHKISSRLLKDHW